MDDVKLDIVRTKWHPEFGLHHWYVFGLNLIDYNKVPCAIEKRPDVLFLTDMTARLSCAAHVGSLGLKDIVDTPEEMFGPAEGATPYTRTRVGFYDGFYNLDEWPCIDSCFFPQVTPLFWQALLRGEDDLEQLINCHSLAFYAAPRSDAKEEMSKLLAAPFPGEAQWLKAVAALYGLVVTTGHDGQYFHVYASDKANLQLIEPSLAAASAAIEESVWFQTHKQELAWDDDLNCCLMLSKKEQA